MLSRLRWRCTTDALVSIYPFNLPSDDWQSNYIQPEVFNDTRSNAHGKATLPCKTEHIITCPALDPHPVHGLIN